MTNFLLSEISSETREISPIWFETRVIPREEYDEVQ